MEGNAEQESEKDKGVEELLKRRAELQTRFDRCSARLGDRIASINQNLLHSRSADPVSDSTKTMPYRHFTSSRNRELIAILKREMLKLDNYVGEIANSSTEIWAPIMGIEKVKVRIESALDKARALAQLRSQTELLSSNFAKQEYEAAAEIVEKQRNVQVPAEARIHVGNLHHRQRGDQGVREEEEGICRRSFQGVRVRPQGCVQQVFSLPSSCAHRSAITKAKRLAKVLCRIDQKKFAADVYLQRIREEIKERCDAVLKELVAALSKKKDVSSGEPAFVSPFLGQIFGYSTNPAR